MSKAALRQAMRQARTALTKKERAIASQKVTEHLIKQADYHHATHIALYIPHAGEISTYAIMQHLWKAGKCCYLPVLSLPSKLENKREKQTLPLLTFAPYQPDTPLRNNHYGIDEPQTAHRTPWQALDMVLVPLLAFDARGYRLGMGKGYYDVTFADLLCKKQRSSDVFPILIGLAYAFQQVERLPNESWDVPLQVVITDAAWTRFLDKWAI